jgi:hypothetical protein
MVVITSSYEIERRGVSDYPPFCRLVPSLYHFEIVVDIMGGTGSILAIPGWYKLCHLYGVQCLRAKFGGIESRFSRLGRGAVSPSVDGVSRSVPTRCLYLTVTYTCVMRPLRERSRGVHAHMAVWTVLPLQAMPRA